MLRVVISLLICKPCCHALKWNELQLPPSHVPIFFNNNPSEKDLCAKDIECPYKVSSLIFLQFL